MKSNQVTEVSSRDCYSVVEMCWYCGHKLKKNNSKECPECSMPILKRGTKKIMKALCYLKGISEYNKLIMHPMLISTPPHTIYLNTKRLVRDGYINITDKMVGNNKAEFVSLDVSLSSKITIYERYLRRHGE